MTDAQLRAADERLLHGYAARHGIEIGEPLTLDDIALMIVFDAVLTLNSELLRAAHNHVETRLLGDESPPIDD